MNTLSLKIPEHLDAALQAFSARRGLSKSAVVREALEKCLAEEIERPSPAAAWLDQWRGTMGTPPANPDDDQRLAYILDKHLR